jgi:hypothetical protein
MPSVPTQPIAPLDEKTAIAQVNSTLREVLAQIEKLNQTLSSIATSLNRRPQ